MPEGDGSFGAIILASVRLSDPNDFVSAVEQDRKRLKVRRAIRALARELPALLGQQAVRDPVRVPLRAQVE
jgi:hypothetical protein